MPDASGAPVPQLPELVGALYRQGRRHPAAHQLPFVQALLPGALREEDISTERARALGGWSRGAGADAGYGDGPRPSTLAAEISKVRHSGLDLSHMNLQPVASSSIS